MLGIFFNNSKILCIKYKKGLEKLKTKFKVNKVKYIEVGALDYYQ